MTNRLLRGIAMMLLLVHSSWSFAQPDEWVVVPSAYEFSMTVTYTISVDGLVGAGSQNVAAIFDATETAGEWSADFLASNGCTPAWCWSTTKPSNPGWVRIWDAELGSLPTCEDQLDFVANGIAGSLSNPIVFYGVYDPLVGCTDPSACNFLLTAITDDGSCIYPGCSDPTACNYTESSPCYDNTSCTFPEAFLDCQGDCLNDFDGDGICDEFEIGGCTDNRACNYNPDATDEDCSCEFPFYPLDCDGNCYLDTDGDGVCEADEVPGCDDPLGCNYQPEATDNDGSCVYCCYSQYDTAGGFALSIERHAGLGSGQPGLEGLTTFRVYVTCPSPDDRVLGVSGSDGNSTFIGSASNFYQSQQGGLLITDLDSAAFADDPSVALDSWLTIGLDSPQAGSTLSASSGVWSTLFEFGEDLFIGGASGDGWSIAENDDAGLAGDDLRVLIGQFSTATPIEGSLNITPPGRQHRNCAIDPAVCRPPCGCADDLACNFDAGAAYDDGTCAFRCRAWTALANVNPTTVTACATPMRFPDAQTSAPPIAIQRPRMTKAASTPGAPMPMPRTSTSGPTSTMAPAPSCWGSACPTDINQDGITAASDILEILAQYGNPCEEGQTSVTSSPVTANTRSWPKA